MPIVISHNILSVDEPNTNLVRSFPDLDEVRKWYLEAIAYRINRNIRALERVEVFQKTVNQPGLLFELHLVCLRFLRLGQQRIQAQRRVYLP